jgi:HSP20 family protein
MDMRNNLETREYVPATRRGDGWSHFPTVGDLFQNFFSPSFLGSHTGPIVPALDLTENPNDYKVVVDVPGWTMDQINVQFADGVLTLSGEQPEKVVEADDDGKSCRDEGRCHIVERTSGAFSRSIKFPTHVDATAIKAALKNGVLTVTVPKSAAAKAQKIRVTES